VIATERDRKAAADDVNAGNGIGSIADDVPKAPEFVSAFAFGSRDDCL
jgi:hypothetical protein